MPIDYLSRLRQSEGDIEGLLASRSPSDEIARTMGNITKSRASMLGNLGSSIQGVTGLRPSYEQKVPQLQRRTEGNLAKQKLGLGRNRLNMIYQNAIEAATNAGYDRRQAEAYARQILEQDLEQSFTASENEKNRQAKRDISSMQDRYGVMNQELQDQYQPENDYAGALLRVLTGVGSGFVTNKYLTRNLMTGSAIKNIGTSVPLRPASLRRGSGFVPRRLFSDQTPIFGGNF